MQYRPLDQLTNQYITDTDRTLIDDSVTIRTELGNSVRIAVNEEIPVNQLEVIDEDGVEEEDRINIHFIVKLGDEYFTSQSVINNLEDARENNNPFYDTSYITIVEINLTRIENLLTELRSLEGQLGVDIKEVLNSPKNLIKQIFWAVTPVSLAADEQSHYSNIGEWTINQLPGRTFNPEKSVQLLTDEQLEEIASENQSDDGSDPRNPGGSGDRDPDDGDGSGNGVPRNPGGSGDRGSENVNGNRGLRENPENPDIL